MNTTYIYILSNNILIAYGIKELKLPTIKVENYGKIMLNIKVHNKPRAFEHASFIVFTLFVSVLRQTGIV